MSSSSDAALVLSEFYQNISFWKHRSKAEFEIMTDIHQFAYQQESASSEVVI